MSARHRLPRLASNPELARLGHDAALSPATVTAVSTGDVVRIPRPRAAALSRSGPVVTEVTVPPATLAAARALARGDMGRVHVRPDGSVLVTNTRALPRWAR